MKHHLAEAIRWVLLIGTAGFIFGFCHYLGWDAARTWLVKVLEWVHR